MADGDAQANSSKNPLLTVVLVLNIILMGGIAFMQFKTHQKLTTQPSIQDVIKAEMEKSSDVVDEKSETGEAKEQSGKLFPLDGFTANLAQGDGPRRFIRLSAVLKLNNEANEEEYKARKPQIRDAVISILNAKRPQDLLKTEGKDYLKEEIKSSINTFLVNGKVIDVYYVGFQIN